MVQCNVLLNCMVLEPHSMQQYVTNQRQQTTLIHKSQLDSGIFFSVDGLIWCLFTETLAFLWNRQIPGQLKELKPLLLPQYILIKTASLPTEIWTQVTLNTKQVCQMLQCDFKFHDKNWMKLTQNHVLLSSVLNPHILLTELITQTFP